MVYSVSYTELSELRKSPNSVRIKSFGSSMSTSMQQFDLSKRKTLGHKVSVIKRFHSNEKYQINHAVSDALSEAMPHFV